MICVFSEGESILWSSETKGELQDLRACVGGGTGWGGSKGCCGGGWVGDGRGRTCKFTQSPTQSFPFSNHRQMCICNCNRDPHILSIGGWHFLGALTATGSALLVKVISFINRELLFFGTTQHGVLLEGEVLCLAKLPLQRNSRT